MPEQLIAFLPGGGMRKLFETRDRLDFKAVPRRASRVEVIEQPESPHCGQFFIDMSPLGDEHQYCLLATFDDYQQAVAAEQEWLRRYWIRREPL